MDSLDYKNLSLILPDDASVYLMMEAAAIKAFINSDGKITEFAFDGETKIVYSGDEIIFDGSEIEESPVPEEETKDIKENTKEKHSIGIIGGADGPTSIVLSGESLRTSLLYIIIYTLIVLGVGFGIGYFARGRRMK